MILRIDDWTFDIDQTTTMAYSAQEASDHCTCDYCLNFYATIDRAYPDLRSFLTRFGVDIEAPDELMAIEPTRFLGAYAVSGRIVQFGACPIRVDGLSVLPEREDDADVDSSCPMPYFILRIGMITVPWVLDVPQQEVVSPANDPSFLEKMDRHFLRYAPMDDLPS